jgi:hypothetical protein
MRVTDFRLGAHDPLRHRGRCNKERGRDLLSGEAADLTQGQGDLGVWWQSGMAAREDQPQTVVINALLLVVRIRVR